MESAVLLQGVTEDSHFEAVRYILAIPDPSRVIFCVAYMKEKGLSILGEALIRVADHTTIVTDICNEITSAQGLKKSIEMGCSTYVVITNTRETKFHPKIYFSRNDYEARMLIGSANLTAGGLYKNVEASILLTMDLCDTEDVNYVENFENKIDKMIEEYSQNIIMVSDSLTIDNYLVDGLVVDEVTESNSVGSDSLKKQILDTIPVMNTKRPKTLKTPADPDVERQEEDKLDISRMRTLERILDCLEEGLSLPETAKVLNSEGLRTRSNIPYTRKSAWHDSRWSPGQKCPRSGSWARTCHNKHEIVSFTKGEVFPPCSQCGKGSWRIDPAVQS